MAYLGTKPSNSPLTSELIPDGLIATSDIADNAITTAKIAAGAVVQADLAAGVAGTGPAFSAGANATTTLATGVNTKILFATEEFDTNSNFASSRFTPTVAGYYQINSCVAWNAIGSSSNFLSIWKNGSEYKRGNRQLASSALAVSVNGIVYCNGSTDYIEIYGFTNGTSTPTEASTATVFFDGALVRAA